MRHDGWVGDVELPQAVREALDDLGGGADMRYIPNSVVLLWEAGWWNDLDDALIKGAGLALKRHLELDPRQQKAGRILMLQQVIEGWKPAFVISNRNPETRDVEEMRKRDWEFRHNWRTRLAEIARQIEGPSAHDEREESHRFADALANDDVLYRTLVNGRHSVLVDGFRDNKT